MREPVPRPSRPNQNSSELNYRANLAQGSVPQSATVPTIEVGSKSGNAVSVTIHDDLIGAVSTTQHQIDISGRERFVPASVGDATLVRACFEFLLRRGTPATSIITRFSLDDIVHYFPDFAGEIGAAARLIGGSDMLLDGKTAVVYGGGGAIGGAVAQAFAEHGAHVIVAGRTKVVTRARRQATHGAGSQR